MTEQFPILFQNYTEDFVIVPARSPSPDITLKVDWKAMCSGVNSSLPQTMITMLQESFQGSKEMLIFAKNKNNK